MNTTKKHPFDLVKRAVAIHTQAMHQFKAMRAGIDDVTVAEFTPCTAIDVDDQCFDVTLAGVTLRCTLSIDLDKEKGLVSFFHLSRFESEPPALLGRVAFNPRNGYSELRHFSEYDAEGDLLSLANPYGVKEVLATYFTKVMSTPR